jgi:threonine/homoserine/homoserine lactone efflux protein
MNRIAPRHRPSHAIAITVVIAAGLLSRSSLAAHLPGFVGTYVGDTLWALALFLGLGLLLPRTPTITLVIAALVIAFGIELSQLYQAPWINSLRGTDLGALILGFGFKWTDLVCYTCGVALGVAAEYARSTLVRKRLDVTKNSCHAPSNNGTMR